MLIELYEDDLTLRTAPKHPWHKGARAVIVHEDKLCMLYLKNADMYTLPGGGIEQGESPQEAVKREVLEETGYEAKDATATVMIREYFHNSRWEHHIFKVSIKDAKHQPLLTDEEQKLGLSVVWKSIDEALGIFSSYESHTENSQTIHNREFIALMNSL